MVHPADSDARDKEDDENARDKEDDEGKGPADMHHGARTAIDIERTIQHSNAVS